MTDRQLLRGITELRAAMIETPVVALSHELDLWAKLEYENPNGSSKDRSAYWILKSAVERGEITRDSTIVESSSGNFAISLANFCSRLGIEFIPVIDPNVNATTERFLRKTCRRVEKVTERDASGGFLSTRLAAVQRLRTELDPVYWPNQYANLDALFAHYRLTGGELCAQLDRLDYLFVGTSTCGTISGLSLRVKQEFPQAKVIAVDASGSAIFGDTPGKRRLPGLGSSMRPPLCEHALVDEVMLVREQDAIRGCHELLRTHGIHAGGSTGSVYAALNEYFSPGEQASVAFLCADRGRAYADTVYDRAWVREQFGFDPHLELTPSA
ncbi:2,3-diaminopropionate biosynthesis protein SbnA [Sciscionella marina]|uniref:2,3-diaminopropionate biosynthesis protein SbnA n=1 Tax=Sciscionella marina TaxID=508770 RepID=UPI000375B98A|nr:2,3-diaminopropionate biosynthesis protein SbnA [Sciscionella marina]